MPIDAVEAILKYRTGVVIDIYTLKTPKKFSNEYLNFKEKNFNHQNLNIVELEVPKDYYYIYNTEAGEYRNRWDLESLMFNRMVQIHLLEKNYNFTLSFYLLDGFIIPISSTLQTKNILYLLGYPKEFNEMRIPILKMYDKLFAK